MIYYDLTLAIDSRDFKSNATGNISRDICLHINDSMYNKKDYPFFYLIWFGALFLLWYLLLCMLSSTTGAYSVKLAMCKWQYWLAGTTFYASVHYEVMFMWGVHIMKIYHCWTDVLFR